MKIHYRAENRKHLAQCVSEFVGTPAVYMRMPTYAYKVGAFTVDFEGNLLFEDGVDTAYVQRLIAFLKERGFVPLRRKRANPPKPKNEPKRMK